MSEDCIFCKIIAGDIPAKVVYESPNVIAFLDIHPMAEGHTLVVSKEHYATLLDFPKISSVPFLLIFKRSLLY